MNCPLVMNIMHLIFVRKDSLLHVYYKFIQCALQVHKMFANDSSTLTLMDIIHRSRFLRIHSLRFPPGVLDKHYEKLLQSDPRLCALAKMPFPSRASPFFNPEMFVPFSLDFNSYPYPPLPTMDAGTPSWASYQPNRGMIDFGVAAAPSNTNYQEAFGLGLGLEAQPQYNVNQWMMPPQPPPYPDLGLNMMVDQTLLMRQHHFGDNSLPPFPGETSASANFYMPPWE